MTGVRASLVSKRNKTGEKEWGVFYFASKKTVWCKTWEEVSKRLHKANLGVK